MEAATAQHPHREGRVAAGDEHEDVRVVDPSEHLMCLL